MNKITFALLFVSFFATAQKNLPDLTLKTTENLEFNLVRDFNEKDKFYILSFWATWCAPCINELDAIAEIQDEYKADLNFEVVAISTDDARTVKRVKPLVQGKGWNYRILLDTNQDLKRNLTIVNIPYTVVLKNNEIVHIQNGYVPGAESELFAKLKTL